MNSPSLSHRAKTGSIVKWYRDVLCEEEEAAAVWECEEEEEEKKAVLSDICGVQDVNRVICRRVWLRLKCFYLHAASVGLRNHCRSRSIYAAAALTIWRKPQSFSTYCEQLYPRVFQTPVYDRTSGVNDYKTTDIFWSLNLIYLE